MLLPLAILLIQLSQQGGDGPSVLVGNSLATGSNLAPMHSLGINLTREKLRVAVRAGFVLLLGYFRTQKGAKLLQVRFNGLNEPIECSNLFHKERGKYSRVVRIQTAGAECCCSCCFPCPFVCFSMHVCWMWG